MFSTRTTGNRVRRLSLAGVVLLAGSGCMDLQVDNVIAPDRAGATANPDDMKAFIGGILYPTLHSTWNGAHETRVWTPQSSETTATLSGTGDQQIYADIREPRPAHDNTPDISAGVGPHGPRNFWAGLGTATNIAYEGLRALDEGMKFTDGGVDVTDQARAFALFMRGWAWGQAGHTFDRFHLVFETTPIPPDPAGLQKLIAESLRPHNEVIEAAVASIEAAIVLAKKNPSVVQFPSLSQSSLWFGSVEPISNAQFIGMANTLAARILVLAARTPAERAAVDWNRVRQFTLNGVTEDFEVQLTQQRNSGILLRLQNNDASYTANMRWDYRTIGLADQSGAYQNWINAPYDARTRFDIVTPDRRITGPTPKSDGSYTRYRADDNGFQIDRDWNLFSAYQWGRHAIRNGRSGNGLSNTAANAGGHPHITVDENNLLRAEAEYYLGNRAMAAELVNITRTRNQTIGEVEYLGLPPVTAAGAPLVNGECVPRMDLTGACGDLITAIRYERMIELAGMDLLRGYMDSRGFGILADGSLLHWPVPGNVLELYDLAYYTYGGPGTEFGAVFNPVKGP